MEIQKQLQIRKIREAVANASDYILNHYHGGIEPELTTYFEGSLSNQMILLNEIDRLTIQLSAANKRADEAERSAKAYQIPMYVKQPQWDNSECPRCGRSFYPEYESCDDGYYRRPLGLDRCPYCGQLLTWDAPDSAPDDEESECDLNA